MNIQDTPTYDKLEPFQKELIIKRANRLQIEEAVITARNIGFKEWEKGTTFHTNWRNIVKELI